MAIQRDIRDNKIQRSITGEVLSSSAAESSKILHIDTDLQLPNRIHKNDTNEVSQLTDKAQNIALVANNPNQNILTYDRGVLCNNSLSGFSSKVVNKSFNIGDSDFTIMLDWNFGDDFSGQYHTVFGMFNFDDINTTSSFSIQKQGSGAARFAFSTDGGAFTIYNFNVGANISRSLVFICRKGDVLYVYTNGGLYLSEPITGSMYFSATDSFINVGVGVSASTNYTDMYINRIYFYTNTFDWVGDSEVDAEIYFKQFHYHKRYKDGEMYLSSKYLKDALIDTDNRIERIYNSIKDTYFEQSVLVNRPRRTAQGIEYLSGESLVQAISDEYTYGTGDFFVGRWVDFKNESVVFSIGGIIEIGIDATNIYTETSGGKLYANRANAINEGFKYIGFHCENGNIYLSVNGLYENSRTESVDYNTDQIATIGGLFVGTDTDMYNAKESIISFSGKVQGNKVFEPPRRGGFNSDIKQY